jgi:HK97 family phage major capsid protein/HK97 family phage prohead protease
MSERAYSLLEVKSIDEEQRIITGIATTPTADRMGDIVEPKGAEFKLPIPLLWQHRSIEPIGEVFYAKVTSAGIEIKARILKIDEPGKLKDRLDEAWQSIKHKLVRGLSIGFSSIEYSRLETGGLRFLKWLWLELSAVTIPANQEASIQTLKSLDIGRPTATGDAADPVRSTKPGASGKSGVVVSIRQETAMAKTIREQITDFEATRAAKDARMTEIMQKAADEGRTLDAPETEEYDRLEGELKGIDDHLVRLNAHEERNKKAAKPIAGNDAQEASRARAGQHRIQVVDNLPKGIRFARYARCMMLSQGNLMYALEIAKAQYPDEGGIHEFLKAAVGAATTANTQGPLLQYTDWMGDFVDFLRPKTIIGKFGTTQNGVQIPGLRPAPFNVRVGTQTAGATGYWVGQGKPIPLSKGTFGTMTLDFHKCGTIAVLTKDEVRFSTPSAEAKVRDDIAAAIVQVCDVDFLNPANAGVANVQPASILNGVVATAVSGADADAVRVDLKNLIQAFITAGISPSSVVIVMSESIALSLSLMRNALGNREFPDLTVNGGVLEGFPVITSEHLTALGSPSTGMVAAVKADEIFLADDGQVTIESSDQASLEMLDSALVQDGTIGTGTSVVSLWQSGLLGLKAERYITWKKKRAAAAQYLSPAAYTPTT